MDTDPQKDKDDSYPRRHRSFYGQIYPGTLLIVVGIIFLLNNFGFLSYEAWGKLWPVFIILAGAFMLLRPRR